jgi:tripartite-type tricarboxylate transporter receptor subunit TctC
MKRLLCCLLVPLVAAAAAGGALAQAWPSKPVTLVVPFPPGGSSDQVARALGQRLNAALGQTFIIENKAGATGTIGAAAVKRAPADGYTFLVTSLGPLVIAPHLIKDIQYDPLKDLDPITIAVQAPNVLVVPASSPHKTMADVIAYQKPIPER